MVEGELRLQRFLESHRLGGDDMHQRATLLAGKDAAVDACRQLLPAQDHAGARAAQGLVRGGRDHMRVRHRRRMHLARHQPGEVGHVDNQVRAHLVRDGAHAREVELARVGAAAAHNHLRLLALGGRFQFVVIHGLGVAAHLVADHAVELAGEVELVAVGQVAAVRQVQAQDGVAGIHQRHVGRGVGLRAGVRLHVGVFRPEDLLGAVARQVLHHVGELASAVVALARIALGVLVGEDGGGRLQHRAADKVLRGNHLQPLVLAHDLMLDLAGNFRVGRSKACTQINWHYPILCHVLPATAHAEWQVVIDL